MPFFLLGAGLVVLVIGAELLVRGASNLALRAGISALVVGLTVVAFGTSAPEMAVSLRAGLGGDGDLALGNVVGSNIFNVLFILGTAAVIAPLAVATDLIRVQVPVMVATSAGLVILAWGGRVTPLEGVLLVGGMVVWLTSVVLGARRGAGGVEAEGEPAADDVAGRSWVADVGLVVAGLAGLIFGARWFVTGAREIALGLGVSELVVGLTVVAAGTSLPELATSVVASLRGQRDIAVGNVVGSNVFNVLAILGITAAVTPGGLAVAPQATALDLPVMLGVAVLALPVFVTGRRVSRAEGIAFLACYLVYIAWLVRQATS